MFTTDSQMSTPADARRMTAAHLLVCCPAADIEAVQIVLSELVANAARHTPAGTWALEVYHDDGALTLLVHDHSERLPQRREVPALDGHGGMGLGIIDQLTDHTCVDVTATGKTITAQWALP
ncbi:ATP-binding protein [Streptomyces sp. NPDC005385]|uniref:ATP-binding protein n=1 Tax=Streptomyces sp. NPDC005385 TaxID=3157039 RepID=UPI0033BE013F